MLGSCAQFQMPVKYFLNTILKETSPLYFSTKDLIMFVKSIEHVFKAFNVMDTGATYFFTPELLINIRHFLLNYYFFEKFRNKPFFDKILQVKWSQIADVQPSEKSGYLNHFKDLLFESEKEFIKLGEELEMEKYERMENMAILTDMLLYILMEFYSRTFDCSHMGRFQMKQDLKNVFVEVDRLLTESEAAKLKEKYFMFFENFFVTSPKIIREYISNQFDQFSFCLTKIFLIVNRSQGQKFNSKKEIVVSSEQEKNLLTITQALHNMILKFSQDEDFLEKNVLAEAFEFKEEVVGPEDKSKWFMNILKFEKK